MLGFFRTEGQSFGKSEKDIKKRVVAALGLLCLLGTILCVDLLPIAIGSSLAIVFGILSIVLTIDAAFSD